MKVGSKNTVPGLPSGHTVTSFESTPACDGPMGCLRLCRTLAQQKATKSYGEDALKMQRTPGYNSKMWFGHVI